MRFKIYDKRLSFFQWDLNQKLICLDMPENYQVHFAKLTECEKSNIECSDAIVKETYMLDDKLVVDVPNILLQTKGNIIVYAYKKDNGSCSTIERNRFDVIARPKPQDYIYTEDEIYNYEKLSDEIKEELSKKADNIEFKEDTLFLKSGNEVLSSIPLNTGNSSSDIFKDISFLDLSAYDSETNFYNLRELIGYDNTKVNTFVLKAGYVGIPDSYFVDNYGYEGELRNNIFYIPAGTTIYSDTANNNDYSIITFRTSENKNIIFEKNGALSEWNCYMYSGMEHIELRAVLEILYNEIENIQAGNLDVSSATINVPELEIENYSLKEFLTDVSYTLLEIIGTKQDKAEIDYGESYSFSLTSANNKEFRRGELTELHISAPSETPEDDFIASVVFTSGDTPTVFTYFDSIKWSGDDVTENIFVPAQNKIYTLIFWYDGTYMNGVARGVAK